MQGLVCTSCGANDFAEDGKYYICNYCGTRYLREMRSTAGAASIEKEGRLSDLLKRADLYWRHNRKQQAVALYKQALELDANCSIANERIRRR